MLRLAGGGGFHLRVIFTGEGLFLGSLAAVVVKATTAAAGASYQPKMLVEHLYYYYHLAQ